MTARVASREKAGAPLCGVHVPGNAPGDSRDPAHLSNPRLWNGPMSLNLVVPECVGGTEQRAGRGGEW